MAAKQAPMNQENLQNIKLVIAYDGTAYLGWQKTETGKSIEGALQAAIEQILQHPVTLQAASRTDAGVHAHGQVVNFFTNKPLGQLDRLFHSINCLLPNDIVVLEAHHAPISFHPTLHCIGKEYRYALCYARTQLPQLRNYSWHYPYELDVDKMRESAEQFIGRYNFSAFCNMKKNASYDDYHREVTAITILELPEKRLEIFVEGNHFLYKMVRNIVGTLVYVGKGALPVDCVTRILSSQDRTQAGITAPANGLSLHRVIYP